MLLKPPILFFGGKGGVGKTTLASGTALALASRRLRTLLVSTDPAHSTSDILRTDLGPEPRAVAPNCWAMELSPEIEADRYIARVKARLADAVPPRLVAEVDRQIDLARASPGAVEAALFERFVRILEREGSAFDRVVFDTAPTGQTLHLLSLPEQMSAWIAGLMRRRRKVTAAGRMWRNVAGSAASGPPADVDPVLAALEERRSLFLRARDRLADPRQTAFIFVVVPERLPIWETVRAVRTLASHGIPIGAIVVNQVLPDDLSGGFAGRRRERQIEHLGLIERDLGAWPLFRVSMADTDPVGTDALLRLGEDLISACGVPPEATLGPGAGRDGGA
jgi:arsenite-transporting ATPase